MSKHAAVHVYVIGPSGGPFKIGVATNLRRRLEGIQTSHPHPLDCAAAYRFPSLEKARSVERAMHAKFRGHCVRGEWFDVDPVNASAAIAETGGELVQLTSTSKRRDGGGISEDERKAMFFESMGNHQKGMTAESIRIISRFSGPECDGPALIERMWQRTLLT